MEKIDELIESVEGITVTVNKLNFDIEGLQEEVEMLEDKRPFMRRQIDLSNSKIRRLATILARRTLEKRDLDAELGAEQMRLGTIKKDKETKK